MAAPSRGGPFGEKKVFRGGWGPVFKKVPQNKINRPPGSRARTLPWA